MSQSTGDTMGDTTGGTAGARGGRPLDVVVLGATGVTGRLVAAALARRAAATGLRWGAAGRDPARVREVLAGLPGGVVPDEVLAADTTDPASLAALAARTAVVLSTAGPYTERADPVVAACVAAGASYADLSGEVPAVARTTRRWDEPARAAGSAVVQVAGFEALPADVAVLLASEVASRRGTALAGVDVVYSVQPPRSARGLSDAVSGGTLASLVAVLREPGPVRLGDPAQLLPPGADAAAVRTASPLVPAPRPRAAAGRVVGAMVPAAFIDPPVLHRTAALLAREQGAPHVPFRLREGVDLGPSRSAAAPLRWALAAVLAGGQAAVLGAARLPAPVRHRLAGALARVLPPAGSGPESLGSQEWRWSLDLRASLRDGGVVRVRADAQGHPGYASTARMLAELGVHLARPAEGVGRAGCLTPALALGDAAVERLAAAGVDVRVL